MPKTAPTTFAAPRCSCGEQDPRFTSYGTSEGCPVHDPRIGRDETILVMFCHDCRAHELAWVLELSPDEVWTCDRCGSPILCDGCGSELTVDHDEAHGQ